MLPSPTNAAMTNSKPRQGVVLNNNRLQNTADSNATKINVDESSLSKGVSEILHSSLYQERAVANLSYITASAARQRLGAHRNYVQG